MLSSDLPQVLPSTDELPCSDDTPVDNEDQNLLPNLLLSLLAQIWVNRMDWFFAVDMALYHTTGVNPRIPVVPDAFLSLGVERKKGGKSRRSYAVWEEQGVVPIVVLEMVSHKPGGEYDEKMAIYANLGVLYYVVYNPEFWRRDRRPAFAVYKLIAGDYQLQTGEPYWMPEVGLGIGRTQVKWGGIDQELLTWYDQQGLRYLAADEQLENLQGQLTRVHQRELFERERAEAERERAEAERQRAEKLAQYLRSIGIDPDQLPS
jgi:Uma2 family endonuclease